MGFKFPAANKLRNRAVQYKRIKKIDVIGNEEAGLLRVEAGRMDHADFCAGEKHNSAAKGPLQPIVFFGIENDG